LDVSFNKEFAAKALVFYYKELINIHMKKSLETKIALVAGATRGAGRSIAIELGAAGATVYCTGRSIRGKTTGRPETIDETAELVTDAGGEGIAIRVDHTKTSRVEALFKRITSEQNGELDILVNDIWGGDELTQWGVPFWEHSLEKGLTMLERAINTHIITSHFFRNTALYRTSYCCYGS